MNFWGTVALLGASALVFGCLAYISVQSLRQARLLRAVPTASLARLAGTTVALHGRVRVDSPLQTGAGIRCLWRRVVVQEISGWGKRRRWRTVSDRRETAGFVLLVGDQQIEVGEPTEVQGTDSRTDGDGAGLLDLSWESRSRVTEHWLPLLDRVTVLGRLDFREQGWILKPARWVGLLLSPRPPEEAARIEALKGWAGMAGVAAGVIATIWICLRY